MHPADLALLRTPGTAAVSPDGRIAVVAVTGPEPGTDVLGGRLWAVPTDGSAPARPLTDGALDTAPAFSPDGRWLAFLRAEPGGRPQVAVLPTAGGAARLLTALPLGAGGLAWSPDSRRLALTARVPDERTATAGDAGPPRLVTTLRHRVDGVGVVSDRRSHVFRLDLPAGAADGPPPVQLTDGDVDDTDVTWTPDGSGLAFVSARHADADLDRVADVHVVPAGGGAPRRVTDGRGTCALPAHAPDGRLVVTAEPGAGGPVPCLVDDDGGLRPLLDPGRHTRADRTAATVVLEDAVLVGVRDGGGVRLLRVPLGGGPPAALVDGPFTVHGVGAGGGVVVATVGHDRSAGELVAITPGGRRLLTGFGRELGATGRLHPVEERAAPSGDRTVRGAVAVPAGSGPHPVVLALDGPGGPGAWALDEATQALVSAGCAVVRCGAAGERAAGDALALLDAVLGDGRLDGRRVGVHGSGAGALPAVELLARTDRFTAGVVERAAAPADPAAPPAVPGPITAPVLVVVAEQDPACPPGLGSGLFAAQRRRGVPAELLLFPGDGHDLARSGPPGHRRARLGHLLRWWARWLGAPGG